MSLFVAIDKFPAGYFALLTIISSSEEETFDHSEDECRPGQADGITAKYIGQVMTAFRNTAESNKCHYQHGCDRYYPLPEQRRHFGDKQIGQESITDHSAHGMSTRERWEITDHNSQLLRRSG